MFPALTAGALLGLASIPHCAAMCGPLAVYAGSGPRSALGYHLGRGVAYVVIGGAAGAFGATLSDALPGKLAGALFSWTLAASLAWTAYRLWHRDESSRTDAPSQISIHRGPRPASLSEKLFAVLPKHPVTIGLLTGVLPCGALYSALLVAASAGGAVGGGAAMLVFGVTSAVGLLVVGSVAGQIQKRIRAGRDAHVLGRVLAAALMVGAVILAVRPIAGLQEPDAPPECHTPD